MCPAQSLKMRRRYPNVNLDNLKSAVKGRNIKWSVLLVFVVVVGVLFIHSYSGSVGVTNAIPTSLEPQYNIKSKRIKRIRNMTEPVKRMTAIYEALPPERNWPEDLEFGFEWIGDPAHSIQILPNMSVAKAEDKFFSTIVTYNIACPNPVRVGDARYGGWTMCLAGPYNFYRPCLVYSFGMGDNWSFDQHVMNISRCAVMAFDPSIGKVDHKPFDLMWFHNIGLAGTNSVTRKNWKMKTFGTMLAELGHTQSIVDVLKVDIEFWEWSAFQEMFLDGSLRNVKQLVFEIHFKELVGHSSTAKDYAYYSLFYRVLSKLGFKFWRHENGGSTASKNTGKSRPVTSNMYFVNANFLI